ncbi:hypothetical protein ASPWEDRAFT_29844 [Aspergillus wentii DTO 134E9]|uniref:Uncharacterized protein n=1 Tax=Aspergillus wentii DTO 134E9 TaxID=1073089 RepID=A0A1L9RCQ4_ASPWE|nr:uncharacterized protein ASPWEDRAFT_29844 [Aspergillus wentii DTO 134E9]OJJ32692.1 hypothetical protein ASPWEDRAFT_29844 [Aspergillus wentii DTO 134E9]
MFNSTDTRNIFQVEVKTVLKQEPRIQFQTKYKIMNLTTEKWLCARDIHINHDEIATVLIAGPKEEATDFEFTEGEQTGVIPWGANCSLLFWGNDGRPRGYLAQSLKHEALRSLGAVPNVPVNEGWLRPLKLRGVAHGEA